MKVCHILDNVRALLFFAKVLAPFWGKAALHVIHVINRTPSIVIQNQTPYECPFGSLSDYHHLHFFGSACFILFQSHKHNKLEPRSRLCCFLSYGETQKGYQCYDHVSHRLCVSQNVVFWEHHSIFELFHYHASLSISSLLELFSDEPYIPSIVASDPPTDFFVQPPYIFDLSWITFK